MKRTFIITLLFLSQVCLAHTLVVGSGQPLTSLRSAVEMAKNGDTIRLLKGIYMEGNIVIGKSIRLIGVDGPVLDGGNTDEILTVTGTDILIRGIHFRNSGYSSMNDLAAIRLIDARFVILENNR